jgi:transcriptional regulator with XRE-family HTH domain
MVKPKERRPSAVPKNDRKKTGKDPELVEFGRQVRQFREAADLTQEALGHAASLHWTYVGQVERGERNPTYKNLLKLARGLGIEPARLMPGR